MADFIVIDKYNQNRPGKGLNLQVAGKEKWITAEDKKRIDEYKKNKNLFKGNHWTNDGGPFPHPIGIKGIREKIPYQQINILGATSKSWGNLIVGTNVKVTSSDIETQVLIDKAGFGKNVWDASVKASFLGFIGLQPIRKNIIKDGSEEEFWTWTVIDPEFLFLEWHPSCDEIKSISKKIPFLGIQIAKNKKIDILYQENHFPGIVHTQLFQIENDNIVTQLDLSFYEFIDPESAPIPEVWETGLDDFLISLVINEKIGEEIMSDYTISAVRQQQALNANLTRIERILNVHANPKLIAPESMARKDSRTGQYKWNEFDSEVLWIGNNTGGEKPQYLTWDGNLETSIKIRDNQILSILNEIEMAPQFTSFSNLFSATVADTASKLEILFENTINKAERKRENLDEALMSLIRNILILSGIENPEFSISYKDLIPEDRKNKISEVLQRKTQNLISTVESIMMLDGISREEAEKKFAEIVNELNNLVKNPFSQNLLQDIEINEEIAI